MKGSYQASTLEQFLNGWCPEMELSISTIENGVSLVKLVGKLDIQGVNAINGEFAAKVSNSETPVILDLSQVDFIASLGMRVLLTAARELAKRGARLVLLKPQALVKEALSVAGLDEILKSYDDIYTAQAALERIEK